MKIIKTLNYKIKTIVKLTSTNSIIGLIYVLKKIFIL